MVTEGAATLLRASADLVCPPIPPAMGTMLGDGATHDAAPAESWDGMRGVRPTEGRGRAPDRPPSRLHAALQLQQRQMQVVSGPDMVVVYVYIKLLRGAYTQVSSTTTAPRWEM